MGPIGRVGLVGRVGPSAHVGPSACVGPSGHVGQYGQVDSYGFVGLFGLIPMLKGWFGCLAACVRNGLSRLHGRFFVLIGSLNQCRFPIV